MRFTMSARTGMPASAEPLREEVGLLDGVAPRRRDEHERGARRRQQLEHDVGAVLEALLHPRERGEERDRVVDHLGADDLRQRPHERLRRDVGRLHQPTRRRHEHAVEAVVEEAGEPARRVEEVERVARRRRVDHDEVEVVRDVQLVELLHRHVLLRARQRAGDVPVEAVAEDALGLLRVGRVRRHEIVERRLRVEHQRPQLARPVAVDLRRRVREALEPERVGEPLGRVDRDDDGAPPGAPPSSASTAAVVVLPTPPEPAVTMISASATSSARSSSFTGCAPLELDDRRAAAGASSSAPAAEIGVEEVRQVQLRQRQLRGEPLDLLALQVHPMASEVGRGAQRFELPGAQRGRGGVGGLRRVGIDAVELGVQPVDDDRPEAHADAVLEVVRGLDELVHRGLLGQRHEHHLAALGSVSSSSTSWACVLIGPTRTASSSARAASRNVMACPAAGASRTIRSAAFARSSCLTLPRMRMSLMPGRGGGHDVEGAARGQPLGDARHPVVAEVLEQGVVGSERASPDVGRAFRPAPRRQRDLVVGERLLAEHRGQSGLALDLHDQRRQPRERGGARQCRRNGGFADAALPGHDDEPGCSEELRWIHGQPFGASVRRLPRRAAILGILLMATALIALAASASAAATPPAAANSDVVMVIQVNGYLDPIEVDFIERTLDRAEHDRVDALVIQLDSPGAVVSDATIARLADRIHNASVDVGVWVGPSGAVALGKAADLVAAAKYRGLAPGSRLDIGTRRVGADEAFTLGRTNIPATCERAQGSTEGCAATIGDFVVSIPSVPTKSVEQNGQTRIEPTGQTRFAQLSLVNRLLHSVASPPVAYLLFVIGHGTAHLRAVHRRRRRRRRRRRGRVPPRLLRARGAAHPPVRHLPARVRHVRLRRRHPDRRAARVDRHRHGLVRRSARCCSTTACRCRGSRSSPGSSA